MADNMPPHPFDPFRSHNWVDGELVADWCVYGAIEADRAGDDDLFCGRVAADPIHRHEDPK